MARDTILAAQDGGGATSPRWIQQLLDSDFGGSAPAVLDPGVVSAAFDRGRIGATGHDRHVLLLMETQSSHELDTPPSVVHAVCAYCDYHFVVKTAAAETSTGLCRQPSSPSFVTKDSRPLHHLVWVESASPADVASGRSNYYPLVAKASFRCSACPFRLELEMSEPRLALDERRLLEDVDRVRCNAHQGDADETWRTKAASTLGIYISNVLGGNTNHISQLNKTFTTVLGPDFLSLFVKLGFTEGTVVKNEVEVPILSPPVLDPTTSGMTEHGSHRAFLEDCWAEVENIVIRGKDCLPRTPYSYAALEIMLGCHEFHRNPGEMTTAIYPTLLEPKTAASAHEPTEFVTLGASRVLCQEYLLYAFHRQLAVCDRSHWPLLTRSLGTIACNYDAFSGLSETAAIEASLLDFEISHPRVLSPEVRHAMETLNVYDPTSDDEEAILAAFYKKVMETPVQIEFLRSMLATISNDENMKMPSLASRGQARLPKHVAAAVLGLDEEAVPAKISDKARSLVVDTLGKEALHRVIGESLTALGYYHNDCELICLAEMIRSPGPADDGRVGAPEADLQLPVGLVNIGNTCYLNSILQLLYSCKVIRDIAMDRDAIEANLCDDFISGRRIGANALPLDRTEGVIAQFFARELSDLFLRLDESADVAIRPSQLLANSALISTSHLLGGLAEPKTSPPPLPARPMPAASKMLDPHMPPAHLRQGSLSSAETERTIEITNESTKTLVDTTQVEIRESDYSPSDMLQDSSIPEPLGPDIEPANSPAPDTTTNIAADMTLAEVKERLRVCLEQQKRSSGTEQQDFEEVHGRILNLLQASIAPSQTIGDVQWDRIMDSFYVTVANYTKSSEGVLTIEVVSDRYITAFPAEAGPCTLYEALDRNFDRQGIEGSKTLRWSSIRKPAPILNVLIQRSQAGGNKNRNQVSIPEVLDLGRYMDHRPASDASDGGFDLLPVRFRAWQINSRIESLQALKAVPSASDAVDAREFVTSQSVRPRPDSANDFVFVPSSVDNADHLGLGDFEHDGLSVDQVAAIVLPPADDPVTPTATAADVPDDADISDFLTVELEDLQSEIDRELAQLRQFKEDMLVSASTTASFDPAAVTYRLHAVICHSGGLRAGHYWVWINDHERGVWRKFNDSEVTEKTDAADVLASMGGDPYYLCYVRAHDRAAHVDSPIRPLATSTSTTTVLAAPEAPEDTDQDLMVF